MTVLVIPEDFRKDQYILKPIFSRLLREVGKPRARIRICQDPLLGGVGEATKSERIQEIIQRYRAMVRIFVLCIDRDGDPGRRKRLNQLEQEFGNDRVFSRGERLGRDRDVGSRRSGIARPLALG